MSKRNFYFIVFLVSLLLSSCSNADLYTNRFVTHTLIYIKLFSILTVLTDQSFIKVLLNLNNFSSKSNSNKADKSRHPTSHYWFLESLIGLTGAILNSSVLYIFYIERQNMISTVNVMTRQGIFITDSLISQLLFSAFTRFFDSCIALLHYGGTS